MPDTPLVASRRQRQWRAIYLAIWRCISYAWALGDRYTFHTCLLGALGVFERGLLRKLRRAGIDPRCVVQVRGTRKRPKIAILDQPPAVPDPDDDEVLPPPGE